MPGAYPGTAIPFQQMPLPQLVQEVLGGSGHVPVSDAAFDYGALATTIADAAGRLRAVGRQLQGAHEGEAADASRRHLERLALVGDAGEAESRLSMTALLDQSRHVAQVRNAVEGARGPLALGGGDTMGPFLAPLAEEARAAAAAAAETYQVETNGNYRSAFQPFEPPEATGPDTDTIAPGRGIGGPAEVAPAAAFAAPAAPGATAAAVPGGGGAGPAGALPVPVVPGGAAPAAGAAAAAPARPGVLSRAGALPPGAPGPPGSVPAGASPGGWGAAGAGGRHPTRPLPDVRTPALVTGADARTGPGGVVGTGSSGGTGSGTGTDDTARGSGTRGGGRGTGDAPSSGRGATGGIPGRGAPLPPETPLPRSSGGEAMHGSTRQGHGGVPLLGGAGTGARGHDGERARPPWLLEDDPDTVWFAGIADWTDPVIGGAEH